MLSMAAELLNYLEKMFPNKKISQSQFLKLGVKGREIYKLAKAENQSSIEWLEKNGFLYTGDRVVNTPEYVENIMSKKSNLEWKSSNLLSAEENKLSEFLHKHYLLQPLIGNVILDSAIEELCEEISIKAANKIDRGWDITDFQADVLIFYVIYMLRNQKMADDDDNLTEYIYELLQGKLLDDKAFYQRIVVYLKAVLERHKRFLSKEKGHKNNYNTFYAHAMSPKESIFYLYDLLFNFYKKDLRYTYIKNDPAFQTFVDAVNNKLNNEKTSEDVMQVSVHSLRTSQQALFREVPGYMRWMTETIISSMASLIENGSIRQNTYADILLLEWYKRKFATLEAISREKKRLLAEKDMNIATDYNQIKIRYMLTADKNIAVSIGKIRLGVIGNSLPYVNIYQNNQLMLGNVTLDVYVSEYAHTTREKNIEIEEYIHPESTLNIKIEIVYENNIIFSTEDSAEYLLFNQNGTQKSSISAIKTTKAYIYTCNDIVINGYTYYKIKDFLYEIYLNGSGGIFVDGSRIDSEYTEKNHLEIYFTGESIENAIYIESNTEHFIFRKEFDFNINLFNGNSALRYQIGIDGKYISLEQIDYVQKDRFKKYILPIKEPFKVHKITVIDLNKAELREVYSMNLIIIPNFEIALDKDIYESKPTELQVKVIYDGFDAEYTVRSDLNNEIFIPDILDGNVKISLPVFEFKIGNRKVISDEKAHIWYKNINPYDCITLDLPNRWSAILKIEGDSNNYEIAGKMDKVEIGNMIPSYTSNKQVDVILFDPAFKMLDRVHLCTIVKKECFIDEPLYYNSDTGLWWMPENVYIGNDSQYFKLEISGYKYDLEYSLYDKNENFDKTICLDEGIYPYKVSIEQRKGFSKVTSVIHEGCITIGEEKNLRYKDKQLHLKKGVRFTDNILDFTKKNEKIALKSGNALLKDMEYIDDSKPNGYEEIKDTFLHYSALLCFTDDFGIPQAYNTNDYVTKWGVKYYAVNRVNVWIVDEKHLILLTKDEDALIVNGYTNSLYKNEPPHNHQYFMADYYEYYIE